MINPDELPSSFYIGQEYAEDLEYDVMRIEFFVHSAAVLDPFEFTLGGQKVSGIQKSGLLVVTTDQKLPRKLIDDLAWDRGNATKYIVGYISKYLPRINQELLQQRYVSGHFLVGAITILDIFRITVSNFKPEMADEVINVPWPPVFGAFLPVKKLKEDQLDTYLMDFIDAGNDYLQHNYNECIRRIITSAENAFRFYGIQPASKTFFQKYLSFIFRAKNGSFKDIVRSISSPQSLGLRVVSDNLLFLYKLRNRIVHQKFRIRFENGWICRRGIATLKYLYEYLDRGGKVGEYVSLMDMQLAMIDMELKGDTVEDAKKRGEDKGDISEDRIIDSEEKMNNWMFESLRISRKEQQLVLGNRVPPGFYKKQ